MRNRFVLGALCFLGLNLFARTEDIAPRIKSEQLRADYERADGYIRSILEAHERTFPGALKERLVFYTPLERLSTIQQGLLGDLLEKPEFIHDMAARGPMTDLTITAQKAIGTDEILLNHVAWAEFVDRIYEKTRSMPSFFGSFFSSERKVSDLLSSEASKLAAFMRDEDKEAYFVERQAIAYVILASLAEQKNITEIPKLRAAVEEMEPSALDYLKDDKSYLPLLKRVPGKKIKEQKWNEVMERAFARVNNSLYQRASIQVKAGSSVTLKEVHPNIAILRGYVGLDCSTSFSPGFVFTPHDHYYYAFDGEGNALGYVGISMVEIGGQKAIYLHTIQGALFTAGQTHLVMAGLQKAAQSFGATRVVLGSNDNISSNVNYFPISQTMRSAVLKSEKLPVVWLDQEYRKLIHKWDSTMTYDDPERNRFGRTLELDTETVSAEVHQTPFHVEFTKPHSRISCERALFKRYESESGESYDY